MQVKADYIDNDMGELPVANRLIVSDDVSGLADKSEEFSNFLTVTRKYGFSCLYVFHTIYPGRQSWEMIMSQIHIFNFFPGSIHSSRISKTLSISLADRRTLTFQTNKFGSIDSVFKFLILKKKKSLTIDTREITELGPGKFRTDAQNGLEQVCYLNRNKSDSHFTSYIAKCVTPVNLVFYIQKLNLDFNLDNKSLEIELNNSVADGISKRQYQSVNKENTENGTRVYWSLPVQDLTLIKKEEEEIDWTHPCMQSQPYPEEDMNEEENIEEEKSQKKLAEKNQGSSQPEDSIIKRHRTRYTATRIKYLPTRVKSKNFLSNISYTGISKSDFYSENFILDVYILLVKILNQFSLQRKTPDKLKHEMVYMLWRECIFSEFYRYICQDDNFKYLNARDVNQSGVLEIVGKFIDQKKDNLRLLQVNLANYKDIYQYVYEHVFPEIYSTTEKRGIDLKSNFHILFKTYRNMAILQQHQQVISATKNLANYEVERTESSEFEKKPVKNFDDFSDGEEEELKQQTEKRKQIRREQSQENKVKKLKLKQEEAKEKESEMWEKMNNLKSKFKNKLYKKENTKRLKNFPAGYVGNF